MTEPLRADFDQLTRQIQTAKKLADLTKDPLVYSAIKFLSQALARAAEAEGPIELTYPEGYAWVCVERMNEARLTLFGF